MANTLVTEEAVKKALGIDSFRNISKEKLVEFVSLIPSMDKDVAFQVIGQFPTYAEMAGTMIGELNHLCDSALKEAGASQKDSIKAYQTILEQLGELLKNPELTPEDQEKITDKMILVADRIAAKDTEFKQFIGGVVKVGAPIIGGVLLLGAAILGVNTKGRNIPSLKK